MEYENVSLNHQLADWLRAKCNLIVSCQYKQITLTLVISTLELLMKLALQVQDNVIKQMSRISFLKTDP